MEGEPRPIFGRKKERPVVYNGRGVREEGKIPETFQSLRYLKKES
jgi:hypothetical protein